jgi:NitT/TauT family transport system permease protein
VPVSRAIRVRGAQFAIVLAAAVAIELLVAQGAINELILTRPTLVLVRLWDDFGGRELWTSFAETARDVMIAVILSLSLGTAIGYALHRLLLVRRALEPLLVAFYSAPAVLLYPIFMIFFGQGSETVVIMAVVLATVPVAINVAVGFSGIAPIWRKVGNSLHATRRQMFFSIMVPAAMPTIVTGFRLGLTFALVGVVALEFLTYSGGLGKLVSWRYFVFDTDGVYAAILLVSATAIVINALLSALERRVRQRWD